MTVAEGRTQLPQHALARREPALAELHRLPRLRADEQCATDRRPRAKRVLDGRLTENEVGQLIGVPSLTGGPRAAASRKPTNELFDRALVLEPHVRFARLGGVAAAGPPLPAAPWAPGPGVPGPPASD